MFVKFHDNIFVLSDPLPSLPLSYPTQTYPPSLKGEL